MNLKDLKIDSVDVKSKVLIVKEADLSEEDMGVLSSKLKKAGAIEVIYAYGGVDLKALTDEDLKTIGLMRIPELSTETH